ncbi:MAG: pantetheine-phosphate adenylyltransferase [Anaerolineales bacterium]|nr:pantetheine-phosphate adenylyltransferase [Anaerolineales bacterium]
MIRAIYPGTFDPVHYGHVDIARRAAAIFDELIVAVYDRPQKDLLFSTSERVALVVKALADITNVRVDSYHSLTVDYAKAMKAQVIVRGLRVFSDFEFEFRMALTNQRMAPGIEMVNLMTREEHTFLSSSTVKEVASLMGDISSMVPPHVHKAMLKRFKEIDTDTDK